VVHPDPVDVIERGRKCRELMQNAAFLDTLDHLSNYHLSALVACDPRESTREARDYHHAMHTAIREIARDIQANAQAGAELEDMITEDAEIDD
jgi:hypothetical protein